MCCFGLLFRVIQIARGRVNSCPVCDEMLFDLAYQLSHFCHCSKRESYCKTLLAMVNNVPGVQPFFDNTSAQIVPPNDT